VGNSGGKKAKGRDVHKAGPLAAELKTGRSKKKHDRGSTHTKRKKGETTKVVKRIGNATGDWGDLLESPGHLSRTRSPKRVLMKVKKASRQRAP